MQQYPLGCSAPTRRKHSRTVRIILLLLVLFLTSSPFGSNRRILRTVNGFSTQQQRQPRQGTNSRRYSIISRSRSNLSLPFDAQPVGRATVSKRHYSSNPRVPPQHSNLQQTHRPSTTNSITTLMQLSAKPKRSTNEDDNENEEVSSNISLWLPTLMFPLLSVYIANQWSRSSIYYLVNFDTNTADAFTAMNVAIGFSEAQYGLLASLAFTALFAIASLGAGVAADRYNRKTLTIASAAGFALATVGTALSSTYTEVLTWRIAMGLFCAFSTPTAYTLINEKVPSSSRSLATSIYGTGVALGGALASLSILLDNQVGWQQALLVIGGVGFASAAIVFLVLPGDDKTALSTASEAAAANLSINDDTDESSPTSFVNDVSEALSTTRAKWIFLGSFLRFSSGLCIGVWSASFFKMTFPDDAANYAVAQAFITAVAGSASGLMGGALADYLSSKIEKDGTTDASLEKDPNGIRLWVPVVGSTLAAPAWYLATHTLDSFQVAMIWLSVEYLVAECWFGPTISTLLSTVPSKIGGTAQGMFTLTGGIANLAPTALGYFYGQATSGQESSLKLQSLLSVVVCFGYISSAVCFALGAQSHPKGSSEKSRLKAS